MRIKGNYPIEESKHYQIIHCKGILALATLDKVIDLIYFKIC